jgi:hypothetical protein
MIGALSGVLGRGREVRCGMDDPADGRRLTIQLDVESAETVLDAIEIILDAITRQPPGRDVREPYGFAPVGLRLVGGSSLAVPAAPPD